MRCELRYLHSPDVSDLESFRPDDDTNFAIFIQALIGPRGELGQESFGFVLCTASHLATEIEASGALWGHARLLVPRFDYTLLDATVRTVCNGVEGATWTEIGNKLSRYFNWEFADYQPL